MTPLHDTVRNVTRRRGKARILTINYVGGLLKVRRRLALGLVVRNVRERWRPSFALSWVLTRGRAVTWGLASGSGRIRRLVHASLPELLELPEGSERHVTGQRVF